MRLHRDIAVIASEGFASGYSTNNRKIIVRMQAKIISFINNNIIHQSFPSGVPARLFSKLELQKSENT